MSSLHYPWSHYRPEVLRVVTEHLALSRREFSALEPWTTDVATRLETFMGGGKTVRGCLVPWMTEMLGGEPRQAAKLGAALEFAHAALMIHDDIIDEDEVRHNAPTLFAQFQTVATAKSIKPARHYGESLAVCVGDMAFFWGQQLLALPGLSPIQHLAIQKTYTQNLLATGLAEMMDTDAGMSAQMLTVDQALAISLYKTARYTFCLPFTLAGLLTEQPESVLKTLDQLGEKIGLLYQVKDDELGIFGDSMQTGKPVGADIVEGKKTIFTTMLHARLPKSDQHKLENILNSHEAQAVDLDWVKNQLKTTGVQVEVEKKMTEWLTEITQLVSQLPLSPKHKNTLHDLAVFVAKRNV